MGVVREKCSGLTKALTRGIFGYVLIHSSVGASPSPAHYLLGRFLFEAGREAEEDRALTAFEEMKNESHSPYPADWLTLLRADRALALGEPSRALSELDRLEGTDGDP